MASGKEAKAAFAKASTWGTAAAVSDSDALLFLSEKITRTREHLPDDSAGQAFYAGSDRGLITCGGDLSAYLRYSGLEVLLAMAMGAAGVPAQQDSTAAYLHGLRMAGDSDGLFGTLCLYKGAGCHEYAGTKVDGFTIEGEAGQPLKVTFNLIADDLDINTTSGTNTAAAMAALATPGRGNRVLFRQGQFLINDADGAALAGGDAIAPSRFSLSFKRNLAGDHLAGGDDRIAEPACSGFPELSLTLEFASYTSDTYLSDLGADTRKKMAISFTGDQIESPYSYSLELLMPHLVITNAEAAVDGAGKIAHPVTLALLATETERNGMSGITAPLALNLINTRTTDPLA